ncbi:NADPH cytochrome P450 oxidoreductase family protein [Microbulbifer thermotolerans]|uniref:NADPH cytochrome P450 oxidoreductase family protein n=1 Tax=Microbulbifer thermotolerans TaxID=252514 RepID=UPI0022491615|nr:NADPH cytochrome P450 oxidoreductase family protein [Microbulbifer thermotolerans]MCX2830137.1 NADPH cytochrome P450 oxidoreductase family protein [Microbulbifer thermotolerans]MCX2841261.1 NADPH cytochrome P450 oxidoreductase family protein [Microbulbifer thermotolerans]
MTEYQRSILAGAVIIAWTSWCLWLYWRQRRVRAAAAGGAALVAYASQSGTAEALARQKIDDLKAEGYSGDEIRLLPLNQLTNEALLSTRRALFVVSTFGDGEPPDNGRAFARRYLNGARLPLDLSHLSYSVIALGDSAYTKFCAFGQAVYRGLAAMGAKPLQPLVRIDSGKPNTTSPGAGTADAVNYWQLADRQLLNPGSPGDPLYRIELRACGPSPAWRAGDVLTIRPRLARRVVEQWLAWQGVDGANWITVAGHSRTLAAWLSERQLPDRICQPGQLLGGEFVDWPLLPEREYSVASRPEEGRLILLVRQRRGGLGSGWLTRYCPVGGFLAGRIRVNAHCHTLDHRRPILLIGAGSGLAGLRAQLAERARCPSPGRSWLIYGERSPEVDRHLASEIDGWLEAGTLSRCDRVFSRAGNGPRYVQHFLTANGEQVASFLSQGADVYVCGSSAGMGEAVHRALADLLGTQAVNRLLDEGRYRRDLY